MKDSTRSALIAVLAIFAVAVAATTIESTVIPESSGPQGPDGNVGGGDGGLVTPPQNVTSPGESLQIPFLTEILTIIGVVAVLAVLVYLYIYWRTALIGIAIVIVVLYVMIRIFALQGEPTLPPHMEPTNWSLVGDSDGAEATKKPSLLSILLLLALLGTLIGTIIAYLKTSSADDETTPDDSQQQDIDTVAVGEAAGRAADRLEQETDIDNEVYRAWGEMTELLDMPNPETSTPGDFATVAVEAGMGEDDVRELTRLFEDIRYGNVEPSVEREERAIDIFRRIEARYAEDES
jgi:hypothetical protein